MSENKKITNDLPGNIPEENSLVTGELLRIVTSQLTKIYGEINRMELKKLKQKLQRYDLCIEGEVDVLRKRLKQFYRKVKLQGANLYINPEVLPFYVVIDFEATCEAENKENYKHEIIEFPGVLVNSTTLKIEETFRFLCKPTLHPKLSEFCKTLTGITQEEVDKAEEFPVVLKKFEDWLKKHELGTKHDFAIVTDGSYDARRFLFGQCVLARLPYPEWGKKWVNIRKTFANFYKCGRPTLERMLNYLRMSFDGNRHSGLDDSKNIAKILIRLICDGANIQRNESLSAESLRLQATFLDDSENLITNLEKLKLEGHELPVRAPKCWMTFEEVKKERYKRECAIAKSFSCLPVADDGESIVENVKCITNYGYKPKKKKKKPRKLCR